MAKFGFDTDDYNPSDRDFEVMPKGEYTLKGTEAEEKQTSKGDGSYISCVFEVTKGEHTGRKVWMNFNINNLSDKAEKIGREHIVGWARACGKPNAQDTDELLERNFQAKLDIEKGTGGYSDKNKISAFLMPEKNAAPKAESKKAPPKADPVEEEEVEETKPEPKKEAPKKEAPKATEGSGAKKRNPWDD